MVKTSEEIEADIYRLINQSELANAISGKVYRDGLRPNNSNKEDVIVIFQTAIKDGYQQIGAVNINTYVPDRKRGTNTFKKNVKRCRELSRICADFASTLPTGDYLFKVRKTVQTYSEPKINQHFINLNLEFRYNIH